MTKILEQLVEKEIAPKVLMIETKKEISAEVTDIKENLLDKFGIQNETAQFIEEKKKMFKSLNAKTEEEVAQNALISALLRTFGSYKIVEYKAMHEIAEDHNLFMTGLNLYKKAIPEENLQDLAIFSDYLASKVREIGRLKFIESNRQFIFESGTTTDIYKLELSQAFYIMAPKSHLMRPKNTGFIGRELGPVPAKPAFKYEFKIHRPEPVDPIIFLPIKAFNKIFCVVITAWDKVADDLRIRQLI